MRIWHYALLPYLSKLQFDGQLRELVAIKRDWETKGTTNHLLINRVMQYPKSELTRYFLWYDVCYYNRYKKSVGLKYFQEFMNFSNDDDSETTIYNGWHTKEYLRSNMANLWEKHTMGVGKSKISDTEWETLLRGYKELTGEDYKL